jgi:hypothetical protein
VAGVYANDWSPGPNGTAVTKVDLRLPISHDREEALRRDHNIQEVVVDEPHRLTVHVTVSNSLGENGAQRALADIMDGPWKDRPAHI